MAKRHAEEQTNRDVLLAFRIEQFRRHPKAIDVRKHLVGEAGEAARQPQTRTELLGMIHAVSAQYRIPIRTRQAGA